MPAAELHREALAELDAEADFLDARRDGLGDKFLEEAGTTIASIEQRPFTGSPQPPYTWDGHDVRAKRVGRFRIWLIYVMSEPIQVVAAKHERQHPDYWKDRLR